MYRQTNIIIFGFLEVHLLSLKWKIICVPMCSSGLVTGKGNPPKRKKNRISTSAHKSTFLIYPYKNKYGVNRVLPLLKNTQAAVTLGVNTKSDCFTPNSSVTVHVCKRILSLKGTKYCA